MKIAVREGDGAEVVLRAMPVDGGKFDRKLADHLMLEVRRWYLPWPVYWRGSLSQLVDQDVSLGKLSGEQQWYLELSFPNTAGNDLQGLSANFDLVWQVRHEGEDEDDEADDES